MTSSKGKFSTASALPASDSRSITLRGVSEQGQHPSQRQCSFCHDYQHKTMMGMMRSQQEETQAQLAHKAHTHFKQTVLEQVLRKLLLPPNKIVDRGVDVLIPEICYFQNGQPHNCYFTRDPNDYHLIRARKDKITPNLLHKLFNDRRRAYRDRLRKALQIAPEPNLKQKKSELKRLSSWKRNSSVGRATSSYSDNMGAAILRYVDGCETLLSENDLFYLLQRRRTDPFWKNVACIRSYLFPVSQQRQFYCEVSYRANKPLYPALRERALTLMRTYSKQSFQGCPDHISDAEEIAFCQSLLKDSQQAYCHYVYYKIIAFLRQFHDEEVTASTARLMLNELGVCYLLDVYSMETAPLTKFNWTDQIHHQRVVEEENRKYLLKPIRDNPQTRNKSVLIQDLMAEEYREMKMYYGVTNRPKENLDEKKNNQVFAFLHPQLPTNISQLVKQSEPLTAIRKKYHIGAQSERRNLQRPFNSRLARQLHELTPRRTSFGSARATASEDKKKNTTAPNFYKTICV